MKWGVRKARKESASANKNYSDKQRKRDRAFYGTRGEKRINKKLNEGYGLQGARHYEAERKERAEKTKATLKKGAKKTGRVLTKIGSLYVTDQLFFDGAGTKAAKNVIKNIGRATVTAYTMARGGYDIHWYDN